MKNMLKPFKAFINFFFLWILWVVLVAIALLVIFTLAVSHLFYAILVMASIVVFMAIMIIKSGTNLMKALCIYWFLITIPFYLLILIGLLYFQNIPLFFFSIGILYSVLWIPYYWIGPYLEAFLEENLLREYLRICPACNKRVEWWQRKVIDGTDQWWHKKHYELTQHSYREHSHPTSRERGLKNEYLVALCWHYPL